MDCVVGGYGVPGVNANGKFVVDLCPERCIYLANTCFDFKLINRYAWRRGGGKDHAKSIVKLCGNR